MTGFAQPSAPIASSAGRLIDSAPVGAPPVVHPHDGAAASATSPTRATTAVGGGATAPTAAPDARTRSLVTGVASASRGPVVRRSMTGSRAPLWRVAAPTSAVAPVSRRLMEAAPIAGARPSAVARRTAAPTVTGAGAPQTGAAPTTVMAAGVPRAITRAHTSMTFTPGITAALASARVAGLPAGPAGQGGPAESGGPFRIRRMPASVVAPSSVQAAAPGWIAAQPVYGPHVASGFGPHADTVRRSTPRLAVTRLPLRTAGAAGAEVSSPRASSASMPPAAPPAAGARARGVASTTSTAPATSATPAAAAAARPPASAAAGSTAAAIRSASAAPSGTAVLRRFSETVGSASGAITPTTVRLMRDSRVLPPPGVVRRAPSPAVPRSATPGSAAPGSAPLGAGPRDAAGPWPGSVPSAAQGAPPIPASALPDTSVIHRFFGAKYNAPTIAPRRSATPAAEPTPDHPPASAPTVVDAQPATATDRPLSAQLSSREWAELVDIVTRRIEGRITAELARRGRRNLPRPM